MDYSTLPTRTLREIIEHWTAERGASKLDRDWLAVEDCQEKIDAIQKELDYRKEC